MTTIWSDARLPRSPTSASSHEDKPQPDESDPAGWRTRFQQDYDRLLFSTPVRRLSDKTQVWPMDENDGVRTRLTHSHEVANLARSIGTNVVLSAPEIFGEAVDLYGTVQPILSAIGLAHDLGNPPFGHQGETAIKEWFKKAGEWIFSRYSKDGEGLPTAIPATMRCDFTDFDGNPQTLRLLTKLQTHIGHAGLDLTAATLAAALKYPVSAGAREQSHPARKKVGYFASEAAIVDWVRKETGLSEGQRHPLTWIMEACDDIAYSVLDVDDVMKKEVISPDDVFVILKKDRELHGIDAISKIADSFSKVETSGRSPEVGRDIKIAYVRAWLIEALLKEAAGNFIANSATINAGTHTKALMDDSPLCSRLKSIAKRYAFSNKTVLKMEAEGSSAIDGLMTFFWNAINDRVDFDDLESRRKAAKSKYGYSLISSNYIDAATYVCGASSPETSVRYRELRLLTDMISGMTDTYALRLWKEVREIPE